jgi:hypothetical protein
MSAKPLLNGNNKTASCGTTKKAAVVKKPTPAKVPAKRTRSSARKAQSSRTTTASTAASSATCAPCGDTNENKNTVAVDPRVAQARTPAWQEMKQTSSENQLPPAFADFALDPAGVSFDDMDWDLLGDNSAAVVPTSVPESAGGLLHKTIYLTQTPFPEVTSLDDKCVGIIEALRIYSHEHNFAATVEDFHTVDRPGEKTMRVVLHCLGSCCRYQVALLWAVGLSKWQIYCQADGIFVHGCSRLEGKTSAVACPDLATTPLYQALDHLADFLDGEVVCPDDNEGYCVKTSCCWNKEEKQASENVRQETRKAVAKVAGVDATASAA